MLARDHETVAEFVFVEGARAGERIALTSQRAVMGRSVGDIVVDDVEVSSVHAMVVYERGSWRILDLGSTNGVYVNERLELDTELVHGAQVRVGTTVMSFRCDALGNDLPAPSPTTPDPLPATTPGFTATSLPTPGPPQLAVETRELKPVVSASLSPRPPEDPPEWPIGIGQPCELEVTLAIRGGDTHTFCQETIVLGRRSVDVLLEDNEASRRHAVIEVYGPEDVFIRDLDSTNGTSVNGRFITAARLQHDDLVRIGEVTMHVSLELATIG